MISGNNYSLLPFQQTFNDIVLSLITVSNQLVGAYEGQQIKLECHSEAYPKSINYWTKEKGDIVPQGEWAIFVSWKVFEKEKKKDRDC